MLKLSSSLDLQMAHHIYFIGMQTLLESERQRADEFEKKFSQALETIENMRVKLEETERRVLQLQEAERRVLQLQDYDCFCLFHHILASNMYTVKIIFASKYELCDMIEGKLEIY